MVGFLFSHRMELLLIVCGLLLYVEDLYLFLWPIFSGREDNWSDFEYVTTHWSWSWPVFALATFLTGCMFVGGLMILRFLVLTFLQAPI